MSRFTIRVEGGFAIASDDMGNTFEIPDSHISYLHSMWDQLDRKLPQHLTAGTRASLSEAMNSKPDPDNIPPKWQPANEAAVRVRMPVDIPETSAPLARTLDRRVSERRFSVPKFEDIAAIFYRCHRVLDFGVADDGYIVSHRPVPSAGGRHAIDLHLLAGDVGGLASGHYRFDPLRCEFVETSLDWPVGLELIREVLDTEGTVPAAIVAVAHVRRTLSRYPNGLSMIWRDAGAALAYAQLCATDLQMSSCIVGTAGRVVPDSDLRVLDVGCLALGAPSDIPQGS